VEVEEMVVDFVCTPFESVYVENSVRIIVLCGGSEVVVVEVVGVGEGEGSSGQGEKRVWMGFVCWTRTGMVASCVMGFVATTRGERGGY
jgi:hypothetical protein